MKYEAILTSTKTIQGHNSGICLIKEKNTFYNIEVLKEKIGYCDFKKDHHDCYDIDYILYQAISSVKSDSILAAGCNISIDWMYENSGGIIGSPHLNAESSTNSIEMINNDLAMYSSPGNIGFIAECSMTTMDSILQIIDFSLAGEELVKDVLSILSRLCINTAILITDGSGPTSKGYAGAINNGLPNIISINK